MDRTTRRQGFTLVELLVVIAIIGILMALLMGSISLAMNKAKKTEALVAARGLATALQAYNDEYPSLGWPNQLGGLASESGGVGTLRENLYLLLTGTDVGNLNPREVAFYTPSGRSGRVGPDSTSGIRGLLDPWGHIYRFSIDLDDDGSVTVRDGNGIDQVRGTRAVVWSIGKDGADGIPGDVRDNVRTWR